MPKLFGARVDVTMALLQSVEVAFFIECRLDHHKPWALGSTYQVDELQRERKKQKTGYYLLEEM